MSTKQKPARNSCWCRRTISRKRRRMRLRTTAPPIRREVTNPARDGPEFSIGATFNIRSLPYRVMPSRLTRSYSDRCLRRRLFRNENESLEAICTADPHAINLLIPRRSLYAPLPTKCVTPVQKKSSAESSVEDFPKNKRGNLRAGRFGRCFRCLSRRFGCRSRSFAFGGTYIARCGRSGRGWRRRRSNSFGFLLTRREKCGTSQDTDVFLHN
jgi:hypothetical protein